MTPEPPDAYSYLGPPGTFTEMALQQVPEAAGKTWRPVNNLGEALADVTSGRSRWAMIAIENSIDGGVSASQDALATTPGLRIRGEYLVPVTFSLIARPAVSLAEVRTVGAHPVAYAQTRGWLERNLPHHVHVQALSNVSAAHALLDDLSLDAAIAPPTIGDHLEVAILAENVGDNPDAVTRFVLVGLQRDVPPRTGADKTSVIFELGDEQPGSLLHMLEQFSARGVNLSLIQSRPIGDHLGRYRFVADLDGHIDDERVYHALLGLHRASPRVVFLGSYPRADGKEPTVRKRDQDSSYEDARRWLRELRS